MRISLQFILLIAMTISLGGEAVLAASPDHDHHIDSVLEVEADSPTDAEYGKHAVHGCGVCHHLVDVRPLLSVVVPIATSHRYDLTSDRVYSRALEPPFQPPIDVSA
ncbi:hypothetical protein [Hyphobacterium sp.]|uniref:hypothetical protein n=1 Tax=Hyphobacterium sp. TaxID=2004662 RepID=UPI003B527376